MVCASAREGDADVRCGGTSLLLSCGADVERASDGSMPPKNELEAMTFRALGGAPMPPPVAGRSGAEPGDLRRVTRRLRDRHPSPASHLTRVHEQRLADGRRHEA